MSLALCLWTVAHAQQPKTRATAKPNSYVIVPTDTTTGWVTVGTDGSKNPGQIRIQPRAGRVAASLVWDVPRKPGTFYLLGREEPLANMQALDFDAWSKERTIAAVIISDSDNASFDAAIPLNASAWRHVHLTPRDFKLKDDSPVKKTALDERQLGPKLIFTDLAALTATRTPGQIMFSNMTIVHTNAPRSGFATNAPASARPNQQQGDSPDLNVPELIDGTTYDIAKSGTISRPVLIRNGGKLTIHCANVKVAASIAIDHGTLTFDHSTIYLANRFSHDISFQTTNGSLLRFNDCHCVSNYPSSGGGDNSTCEIRSTDFSGGGFTAGNAHGTIILDHAKLPGEFIIEPGTKLVINDCDGVLIWPTFKSGHAISISFPSTPVIDHWNMPANTQMDVTINRSSSILWAVLTETGCDLTISDSNLVALGIVTGSAVAIAGVVDNNPDAPPPKLTDRRLVLKNTTVRAWNVYPRLQSQVKISDSIFGELNAFDNSHTEVANSTCDGLGGYVLSQHNAYLKMTNCTINCPVVAADDAVLVLDGCTVNGAFSASGRARVKLVNTKLSASVQRLEQAVIEH